MKKSKAVTLILLPFVASGCDLPAESTTYGPQNCDYYEEQVNLNGETEKLCVIEDDDDYHYYVNSQPYYGSTAYLTKTYHMPPKVTVHLNKTKVITRPAVSKTKVPKTLTAAPSGKTQVVKPLTARPSAGVKLSKPAVRSGFGGSAGRSGGG